MYVIELTPKWQNATPHIWKEGAEFQAKQIRKMRSYKKVKVTNK